MTEIETESSTRLRLCEAPELPNDPDVKEHRLALVCYGGVSLAIYMHGITKELEKLVRASRAFAVDRVPNNPFPTSQTEHVYFDALERKASVDGYRTLVTVDIISGTSAGGINGIYLAKALALGTSQEGLRDLWLRKGSILRLYDWPLPRLPPLAGKRILGWLQDALEAMDTDTPAPLMPPGLTLDLFVTSTDAYGWNRPIPIRDPTFVTTPQYKVVWAFHQRDEVGNLGRRYTPALAFAARSTSSFPGAFPPASIEDIEPEDARRAFPHEFCRAYELARPRAQASATFFIDGGVLDNYPFRNAIRAIPAKPAATEVERSLLFIEPDPKLPLPPADGYAPGFLGTIKAGTSKLPRQQPIADSLDELSEYNRRVRRVRQMIAATTDQIRAAVDPLVDDPYQDANRQANEEAMQAAGPAFTAYLRLKIYTVVEGMADGICRILDFPQETAQAAFVRAVVLRWAEERGLLGTVEVGEEARRFLRTFDLGYGRRRLTFTIGRLNTYYRDPQQPERVIPERGQLNEAKVLLYRHLCELRSIYDVEDNEQIRVGVEQVFGESPIDDALAGWDIEGFLKSNGQEIDRLRELLGDHLETGLSEFGDRVNAELQDLTAGWPAEIRQDVLSHYIGFPYWDAITFTARALSEVGELDEVEVIRISPLDTVKLVRQPEERREKLRGVAIHHFGAFFKMKWRQNDYLWGRLDGAERLLAMILADTSDGSAKAAFRAILEEDGKSVKGAKKLISKVRAFI